MWTALATSLLCAAPGHHYALVFASNEGDPGEERLRFANDDARRVLEVLRELGGVAEQDAVLLLDTDAKTVERAISQLRARAPRDPNPEDRLFIYVSSHADEGFLHLSGTHLPLRELTKLTEEWPVGVAVLVVDSCRSGAATRLKGLRPVAGTLVNVDAPSVGGRVIITSSGADELAQESDSLGGSFFTHYWVAGLRGAADFSGDLDVTLEEAYTYAYSHTVQSTFATPAGIQHPSFHVDLKGSGSLVLTTLGDAPSRLRIAVGPAGEWSIFSVDGGRGVAELEKAAGPATLALPAGTYLVQTHSGGRLLQTSVVVPPVGEGVVEEAELTEGSWFATLTKGGPPQAWVVSGGAQAGTAAVPAMSAAVGGSARLQWERAWWGPIDALSLNSAYRGAQAEGLVPFEQQEWDLFAGAATGWRWGRLHAQLGVDAGATLIRQNHLIAVGPRDGIEARAQLAALARWKLWGPLALSMEVDLGPGLVPEVNGLQLRGNVGATVGLAALLGGGT
jgi:hypothetical protein